MFVTLLEPPQQTRLVDATQMIGARRLVEQGWDVCTSYLDGYFGEITDEAVERFIAEWGRQD